MGEIDLKDLDQTPGPSEEEIRQWLTRRLSDWLAIEADGFRLEEPFASYGLTSIAAVSLSGQLSEWLEIELSPAVAFEYPNIGALARYLANEMRGQGSQENGGRRPPGSRTPAL